MTTAISKCSSLQAILTHHRRHRSGSFDRDTPFSWTRCVIFLFSYSLVLSDVFRSGLDLRDIAEYPPLEPNVGQFLGSYGYPVVHIDSNATEEETMKIWSYKFDTTSVTIRAVAQYLNITSWTPCVLYKISCDDTRINLPTVFTMLDTLVESVAKRTRKRSDDLPGITLRTENVYFDRLHEYVFPFFFKQNKRRTVQALYYNTSIFNSGSFNFCTKRRNQPHTCNDAWINFRTTCSSINKPCIQSRNVWSDITARSRLMRQKFTGMQLDMLFLEGYEDRGIASISFQGRQQYDITLIVRTRNCPIDKTGGVNFSQHDECSTIAIDDYRYEGGSLASDVAGWYNVISIIRIFGQGYAWLRLAMLFIGCYWARSTEQLFKGSMRINVVWAALRTMLTAPSQVVTYGSIIPVILYTIAHLLDSMMVYEEVGAQFTTLQGAFNLNVRQFIRVVTVSMRSLWVFSTALHIVLLLRTRCCWASTSKGIPGIPELFINAIAFLTISAQYRSISFRNSHLVLIREVEPSFYQRALRAARYNNTRGFWYIFFLGDNLDFKCLTASTLVVSAFSVVFWGFVRVISGLGFVQTYEFFIWPHTLVSYAAGSLWPINALMVSWNGYIFTPVKMRQYRTRRSVVPIPDSEPTESIFDASRIGKLAATAFIINYTEESRVIRNAVAFLDGRSREVHATLCLMNLTVMTDPIVFCRLYWFSGCQINIYRSARFPKQFYFIPKATADSTQNLQIDYSKMELLAAVNSMDLPWMDLLQCG